MTPDLKPCPFCGGKELIVTGIKDPFWHLYPAEVICLECSTAAVFLYTSEVEHAKQVAVEKWNRRVICENP